LSGACSPAGGVIRIINAKIAKNSMMTKSSIDTKKIKKIEDASLSP
jgi:hypothetical protein